MNCSLPGFNYRRVRTKPKEFTDDEKLGRLVFVQNFSSRDIREFVFVDETSVKCGELGIYHNRQPATYPEATHSRPRNSPTVHVWAGISWNGMTDVVVSYI